MSRKLVLDDIDVVTEFMLNTCRLCPRSKSKHAIYSALLCGLLTTKPPAEDEMDELIGIPLTTGSVAEFYIEPMLPHVGDIDVMYYLNHSLAIPQGHPPPTQLPAEFHNYVKVYEIIDRVPGIIDSHLPGYVYLELRYLLTECGDDDKYNAVECDRGQYAANRLNSVAAEIHGPAEVACLINKSVRKLSVDEVRCMRCRSWPPQAADWPTRQRNYGWPDSATLDHVVSNGCDVVGVAHRRCRQHDLMGKNQQRLSFSRAEIVLINSWMPVQQIVYHMLRYFLKTERLTDCAQNTGEGKLSNYYIKTLMLWACELKSRSWWVDDKNLMRICVQLLHILAEWLTFGRYQHYFINNCNLIDNSFNATNIIYRLMSMDEMRLSTWFVDNYILACLQLSNCPRNISWLFYDVTTNMKLQNAVSALVTWRRNSSVFDLWQAFDSAEFQISSRLYRCPLTARSCVCWMTEWTRIDSCLSVYFTAVVFLYVASRSLRHGFNDELMDILAAVCGQFTDTQRHPNNSTSTSVLSLNKAAKLMKVVVNKSLHTTSLIEIELSKEYLYRALRYKDSDSDSIYCLANVYFAVLYYTTGQYQTAIDHCTLVIRSQDHSQCRSHVVRGEMLPKIDDDVDNILGLAELYKSVRTAALKQQRQPQLVSIFTTQLFAYYLHVKYLSITECCQFMQSTSADQLKRYKICISDTHQLFIGDVLLFLSVSRLLNFQRRPIWLKPQHRLMNTNKNNSPDLVELLQKSAVEHLTTYRQIIARDFGSVAAIVATDFEAVYAYKRGDYQRCLQLSTQNVHTLLSADYHHNVVILPDVIQLMDDDIVSLTAVMVMVTRECRNISDYTSVSQLTLSLYLMTQCQLKLQHSATSLAQTLDYIEVAQRDHPADRTLDQLTLKLIERKVVADVNTLL